MKLYDCLYPHDRPFLPRSPMPGMSDVLVDGQRFYAVKPNTGGARDHGNFDPNEARKWPSLSPGALCIVNKEHEWDGPERTQRPMQMDIRLHRIRDIIRDCDKYNRIINAVREGADGAEIGVYGYLPAGYNVFNAVITNDRQELGRAQAATDIVAGLIGDNVDVVCPSLYVNSANIQHWIRFTTWQVSESRRIAQVIGAQPRIVPFISPEIHPSAGRGLISPEFWQTQVKTLRDLGCDGAVLWYSSNACTMKQIGPYGEMAVKAIAPVVDTVDHQSVKPAFPPRAG